VYAGVGVVYLACVPGMLLWISRKVLYIEIEMLFETSLSADHDQSSIWSVGWPWSSGTVRDTWSTLPVFCPEVSGTSAGFTDTGYSGVMLPLLLANFPTKCSLSDPVLKVWDNCKNEIMQKWPISFINLFFWKLSCTINCVQLKYIYIYIYILTWVKSTLSQQSYVIGIWREFPNNLLLLLLFLVCMGFLFCSVFVW
jgi:hypothetical protein